MIGEPMPLRPLNLGALFEAAEASGLTDDQIGRLILRLFPEAWEPGYFASPQSDGFRIHALPCGAVAGPDHGGLTAGELPTDEMIDKAVALRATGSRPTLDEINE